MKDEKSWKKKGRAIKNTPGETAFDIFNVTFVIILALIMLYPLWYVIIGSFSDPFEVDRGHATLWVQGFNITAYKKIFALPLIWSGYANTLFFAFFGVATSLVMHTLGAYPLSKQRLKGRRGFNFVVLFTMWFGAGLIPTYVNFRNIMSLNVFGVQLVSPRLLIIIAFAISSFYFILMRTFFENIPSSMEESAKMDGASDLRVLLKIYVPLSVPVFMTLGLYFFVDRWNGYFWSMILLRKPEDIPLQVVVNKLIDSIRGTGESSMSGDTISDVSEKTMVYAGIVVAVLPMLAVYPFIQKFFVKGIMVGAIKG